MRSETPEGTKKMTPDAFNLLLDDMLELDPGTITGTERLEDLENWDSLAVISFIALGRRAFRHADRRRQVDVGRDHCRPLSAGLSSQGRLDVDEVKRQRLPIHGGLGLLRAGDAAHQPLVLLHGYSGDLLTWQYQIGALARRHHVIALDLPGHGLSATDRLGIGVA